MPAVIFSPAARAEMIEAADWYGTRAPGLVSRFIVEIDAAVERVAANPRQFPLVFADVRRVRLQRFPYALFFRVTDADIHVIACFHGSRDPRRWRTRV